ncbi:MAG TPA: hypothetical protein PKD85_02315 [Saprospiraceae bacterium]|nr:hypothetical protein [Saprospiraceae bacterium]
MSLSKVPDVYDFINLEDVSAKDYLGQDPSNIIIVIGNSSMGYSKEDLYKSTIKDKTFYECKKKGKGLRVSKDDIINVPYAVIRGQGNYYVDIRDLKVILKSTDRVFRLVFAKDVKYMASKDSIDVGDMKNWRGQDINLVSSWHCQEGTNVKVYRIEPFDIRLPNQNIEHLDQNIVHLLVYAPQTVIAQILFNLPPDDLESYYAINKRIRNVCRSQNVRKEYYKKWNIYEPNDYEAAEGYLKNNPSGLLSITKDSKIKLSEILKLADKIVYLDTKLNTNKFIPHIAIFKKIKRIRKYYKDIMTKEIHFKDGKFDGLYKIFHESGAPIAEGIYKDNKKEGLWKNWEVEKKKEWGVDESDDVHLYETYFHNGKKEGIRKEYVDGVLTGETTFKNGYKDGIDRVYNNGKLKRETTYKNGKKHGIRRVWHEDGTIREILYEDGEYVDSY